MPTRTIAVETPENAAEPEPQPPGAAVETPENAAEPEPQKARVSSWLRNKLVSALIGVGATVLVGALAFIVNDFDGDIKKLDSGISDRFAQQDADIDDLDTKIDTKIGELDTKIDTKFGELDDKIDTKFGELDDKIDTKFDELDDKIDTKFAEADTKIGELDDKVDEIAVMLASLIARLEESGTIGAAGRS